MKYLFGIFRKTIKIAVLPEAFVFQESLPKKIVKFTKQKNYAIDSSKLCEISQNTFLQKICKRGCFSFVYVFWINLRAC